jgi:hypothetical protein
MPENTKMPFVTSSGWDRIRKYRRKIAFVGKLDEFIDKRSIHRIVIVVHSSFSIRDFWTAARSIGQTTVKVAYK